MKKILLLTGIFASLFSFAQPTGCDTAAIRTALTNAGYYMLNVPTQPCSMYFVNPTSQSSILSEQDAQQFGAHMVSFQTAQENQDVLNALYNSPYSPANYTIWIGLSDAAQEGTFVWLDGAPVTYTNWNPGEPNDLHPSCCNYPIIGCQPPDIRCQDGEDCVQMYGGGTWNDFGCDVSSISVIEINLCPQITATPDTSTCPGTPLTLNASTILGCTPYTYTWSPGGATGSSVTESPSTATTYSVEVTDRWGCQANDSVVVAMQNCPPPTNPSTCDVQAIRNAFTAAGYYELTGVTGQDCSLYFINPTSQDANLSEQAAETLGAHLVVFNDAAENQAVVAALNAAGIISSVDAVWVGYSDQITEGNWLTLDGTPLNYTNWASGEPNNLGQNASCCSIPDWLGGCQSSEAWRCQYGEDCAQIYSAGTWNDLPCDRNSVSVVEVNLCPKLNASADTTICGGNTVNLSASTLLGSPPYTYSWMPGGSTGSTYSVTPTSSANYVVHVSDRWSCTSNDTIAVTVQGGGVQSFTINPDTICENQTSTITYTGNSSSTATYTWSFDGANIMSGTGQGPYQLVWNGAGQKNITIDVTDNGCTSPQVKDSLLIHPNPVADAGPDASVCSGGNIQLGTAPVSGYQYVWQPGIHLSDSTIAQPVFQTTNSNASPLSFTYLMGASFNGCYDLDTVNVTVSPAALLTITPDGPLNFCMGGSVTLQADSGFASYLWNDNSTANQIITNQAGSYFLTAADTNGCAYYSDTVTISIYPNPAISLVSSTNESCYQSGDGSITVSAANGSSPYSYLWNTTPAQNAATANGLNAGTYSVTVSDAHLCTDSASFSITAPLPITITIDQIQEASCFGYSDGAATLSATGGTSPYQFIWNSGISGNTVSGLAAGSYQITVADANNCTDDTTLTITEPAEITLQSTAFDSVLFGTQIPLNIQVNPTSGSYTYQWNPGSYLSCTDCETPTFGAVRSMQYQVTVTDASGCSATGNIRVNVLGDKKVFIPNVFTPNHDSQNDLFQVYAVGLNYYNLKIFNRTGEKVFDSYNASQGWDGTYSGKDAPPGVYVYLASINFLDGETRTYKGTVTLLR